MDGSFPRAVAQGDPLLTWHTGPAPWRRWLAPLLYCYICLMSTLSMTPWSLQREGWPHGSTIHHLTQATVPYDDSPCFYSMVHLACTARLLSPFLAHRALCLSTWRLLHTGLYRSSPESALPLTVSPGLPRPGPGTLSSFFLLDTHPAQTTGAGSDPPRLSLCTFCHLPSQCTTGHGV